MVYPHYLAYSIHVMRQNRLRYLRRTYSNDLKSKYLGWYWQQTWLTLWSSHCYRQLTLIKPQNDHIYSFTRKSIPRDDRAFILLDVRVLGLVDYLTWKMLVTVSFHDNHMVQSTYLCYRLLITIEWGFYLTYDLCHICCEIK